MARNRIASGVVMVPCVLLGSAFLSTAFWADAASGNRSLALTIGGLLLSAGLRAVGVQSGSTGAETETDESDQS